MKSVIEGNRTTIIEFIKGFRGELFLTSKKALALRPAHPYVTKIVVCDPRRNAL
jgi:hypothetical protein